VFPLGSLHETAPAEGFIAKERSTLFPAATPAAGTVIDVAVPLVFVAVVPIVLTKVIWADAGEAKKFKSVTNNATLNVTIPRLHTPALVLGMDELFAMSYHSAILCRRLLRISTLAKSLALVRHFLFEVSSL